MTTEQITLSHAALQDLRLALNRSYGIGFDTELSDEQVNKLGLLLLSVLAENLMLEITRPELPAINRG